MSASSSLQVVNRSPIATAAATNESSSSSPFREHHDQTKRETPLSTTKTTTTASTTSTAAATQLDFVGSSNAVKELFTFPYTTDRPISVAVHNIDGTLLLEADGEPFPSSTLESHGSAPSRENNFKRQQKNNPDATTAIDCNREEDEMATALVALSSLQSSEAVTIVNSVIESSSTSHPRKENHIALVEAAKEEDCNTGVEASSFALARLEGGVRVEEGSTGTANTLYIANNDNNSNHDVQVNVNDHGEVAMGVPSPDDYMKPFIPCAPQPREYLSWKFHDMDLLVGSNALVYRSSPPSSTATTKPTSLTVRMEDASQMKALLQRHQEMIRSGQFIADHHKPSYAEAARKRLQNESGEEDEEQQSSPFTADRQSQSASFSATDLDSVRLQSCIVPAPSSSIGGLLSVTAAGESSIFQHGESSSPTEDSSNISQHQHLSPISTVLDAYLDNIMANVPQLALCLREKGFIQSVKLMQTEEIPSIFMQQSTFDTSSPFSVASLDTSSNPQAENIFSPQIMEMNASTLLRFLKANCTRDNATYMLRREAGRANIQLYDISSISAQRQQKWIWWLAMMSYRFANRLCHLSLHTSDNVLRRTFRTRQRALLQNTLDMLEVLSDMDELAHESLVAAIHESLANTFLAMKTAEQNDDPSSSEDKRPEPATRVSFEQPYGKITADALSKAHDHLASGKKILRPVLERNVRRTKGSTRKEQRKDPQKMAKSSITFVTSIQSEDVTSSDDSDDNDDSSDDEIDDNSKRKTINKPQHVGIDPVATQLFGLNHTLVNVCLRLSEIHLRNYFSSNAMQSLREAARLTVDSLYLIHLLSGREDQRLPDWLRRVKLQYIWLWEHCGHFARSFAADELFRERGHTSGDDIVSVLQDVEAAFSERKDLVDLLPLRQFIQPRNPFVARSNVMVDFDSLSGIVDYVRPSESDNQVLISPNNTALNAARGLIDEKPLLQREHRKVLVAACVAYERAIQALGELTDLKGRDVGSDNNGNVSLYNEALIGLLHQRLGDACNETGKILLTELKTLLASLPLEKPSSLTEKNPSTAALAADPLLSSAEFWFQEGLRAFEECHDLRNLALLRCNLCQCWKLRANAIFDKRQDKVITNAAASTPTPTHPEMCLQEAANQLQAAHEALGQRETDERTWDMVSNELAATFLVLGVRRRQSLIGSGNTLPLVFQALRLSPGEERSIVDPMDKALTIYLQMGNHHQAAATHYQLALLYSKIWTCQRDETKTREKLSAAFGHYNAAHAYFSQSVRGNEATFCLLCIDLSNLYKVVAGEECLAKALGRCLDTSVAFSPAALETASSIPSIAARSEWFQKMDTLASSVEERVFKLLRDLVKLSDTEGYSSEDKANKYKELYRVGLHAKMMATGLGDTEQQGGKNSGEGAENTTGARLLALHQVLETIKTQFDQILL